MARKPMVTRTIKATEVTCMCVNTTLAQIENISLTVPRTYKTEKLLVKAIEKANLIPEEYKLVQIVEFTTVCHKYGMTEEAFLATATPIE